MQGDKKDFVGLPRNWRDGIGDKVKNDTLLWQLSDSAFPAGGFAHSGGLESVGKWGLIRDEEDLVDFLYASLRGTACSQLAFVTAGVEEPENTGRIDGFCDAFLSNHVANRASRRQGRSFVMSSARVFRNPSVEKLERRARDNEFPGHFAPMFGVVCGLLGLVARDVRRLYLFTSLRGLISSAVRLGLVGPIEGQGIQYRFGNRCTELADAFEEVPFEEATQINPVQELLQATHDRIYSRLFQS